MVGVAHRIEDLPDDPVLVVINDEEDVGTFDEWRALLAADEPHHRLLHS